MIGRGEKRAERKTADAEGERQQMERKAAIV